MEMRNSKSVATATERDLDQLSVLFRVLADKTRLQILLSLADGEKNVTALCNDLNLPQPTVSHNLSLLRMNNVVAHRRNGKQVFYGIEGRIAVDRGELVLGVQNMVLRIGMR